MPPGGFRGDLLERVLAGEIETRIAPVNPLDVVVQQVVAMGAMDERPMDELAALLRRAHRFHDAGP